MHITVIILHNHVNVSNGQFLVIKSTPKLLLSTSYTIKIEESSKMFCFEQLLHSFTCFLTWRAAATEKNLGKRPEQAQGDTACRHYCNSNGCDTNLHGPSLLVVCTLCTRHARIGIESPWYKLLFGERVVAVLPSLQPLEYVTCIGRQKRQFHAFAKDLRKIFFFKFIFLSVSPPPHPTPPPSILRSPQNKIV